MIETLTVGGQVCEIRPHIVFPPSPWGVGTIKLAGGYHRSRFGRVRPIDLWHKFAKKIIVKYYQSDAGEEKEEVKKNFFSVSISSKSWKGREGEKSVPKSIGFGFLSCEGRKEGRC